MARRLLMGRVMAVAAVSLGLITGAATAASAAPSPQDTTWMAAAHQSNLTEIAAGTSAQTKATSQSIKDLGAMFVQMHTALDADLKAGAAALNVTLPDAPSPAQQATLASVDAKSGAAYDSAWVTTQLAGHREALAATQKEISSGSDAAALKLANASLPVIQQHISALQALPEAPSAVQAGTGGQAAEQPSTPWVLVLALAGAALLLGAFGAGAVRRRQRA